MGTVKAVNSAQSPVVFQNDEKEQFEKFMEVMVQIVEKYGQTVLHELDDVA